MRPGARDRRRGRRGCRRCADPSSAADVESFLRDYAAALCDGLAHCESGRRWADRAECTLRALEVSEASARSLVPWRSARAAAREGRLALDRAAADACIAAARASCPDLAGLAACSVALRTVCGAVEGEPCGDSLECAPGLVCDGYTSGAPFAGCRTHTRTCRPVERGTLGGPCQRDGCASDGGEPLICVSDVCRRASAGAPAATGEPCGVWRTIGSDEAFFARCAPGLACADATSEPVCVTPTGAGESCDGLHDVCAAGSRCVAGACVAYPEPGVGAPCDAYPVGDCGAGMACEHETCVTADGSRGSWCSLEALCQEGLGCDGLVCGDPGAIGDHCTVHSDCTTRCCDLGTGALSCR